MTESTLPLATVYGLYHIAIKTSDLGATRKFWTDIIGLKEMPRPDFGYPGAWLGCPQPGHMYAQVITSGWIVLVSDTDTVLEYHTDAGQQVVLCRMFSGNGD